MTPGTKVRTKAYVHAPNVALRVPAGVTGVVVAVLWFTRWPVEVRLDALPGRTYFYRSEELGIIE